MISIGSHEMQEDREVGAEAEGGYIYLEQFVVVGLCFQVAAVFDGFFERGRFGCECHGCCGNLVLDSARGR